MIEVFAPGKLFIAGEYATVEPGEPAMLVAINRHIRVRVESVTEVSALSADGTEASGSIVSAEYRDPLRWVCTESGAAAFLPGHDRVIPRDLVTETLTVMAELATSRGVRPNPLSITLSSDLTDGDGNKFGLGSSAAVTVGLVDALAQAWGIELTRLERFKLALMATLPFSPRASGGDIATSTLTGWVRYASPNRLWVAAHREAQGVVATLDADWEGLELVRLPNLPSLTLTVGWTGSPAKTDTLVNEVQPDPATRDGFLTASRSAVNRMTEGFVKGDVKQVLAALSASRDALLEYDRATGSHIETPELFLLRTVAERHGAVAKPSGAGGGDCGIILSDRHVKLPRILEEWQQEGIRPLPLSVYTQEEPR